MRLRHRATGITINNRNSRKTTKAVLPTMEDNPSIMTTHTARPSHIFRTPSVPRQLEKMATTPRPKPKSPNGRAPMPIPVTTPRAEVPPESSPLPARAQLHLAGLAQARLSLSQSRRRPSLGPAVVNHGTTRRCWNGTQRISVCSWGISQAKSPMSH